jgi:hypothetical protein
MMLLTTDEAAYPIRRPMSGINISARAKTIAVRSQRGKVCIVRFSSEALLMPRLSETPRVSRPSGMMNRSVCKNGIKIFFSEKTKPMSVLIIPHEEAVKF